MNMCIISTQEVKLAFGRDRGAHPLSLASLGCVFNPNQCQCVQENTIHVTGSGFSRIYYRQRGGCSALMDGTVLLVRGLGSAEVLNHDDRFRFLLCYLDAEDKQIWTWQTACGLI